MIKQLKNMPVKPMPEKNGVKQKHDRHGYSEKRATKTVSNGFFTVDQNWTVRYWNRTAEYLLGVEAKDIVGKNFWEKFRHSLPTDFYTVYRKAFLKDIPPHFEEYWGKMGAWFDVITYYCQDTLSVSFKSGTQPVRPEHPEPQLKTLVELYRLVTVVTNDCLWDWNLITKEMLWIDGGHKRVFGYQIENALIPQSFWESRLHPGDKMRILTRLNKILVEGSASDWEDEYRFQRGNGEYAFVHDRAHIIYSEDKQAIRMVGATQDITARKLAEARLLESESKLVNERLTRQKQLTHAVLSAQENERADIGRELHDNLNQILGAAKLYIEMARSDEENREMCLGKSSEYIVNVIEEIRRISKSLGTPGLVMGLFDSIDILLDDLMVIHPIKFVFFKGNVDDKALNEKLQLTIFRIIQEQLNNILRHANATSATISLSEQQKEIILTVSDNGKGCNTFEEEKGIGNINIKSRVELYHGTVTIVSEPNEGYELRVVLPLKSN
jgi:PAS domain S-box-containing protein